eukprot:g26873.t1
MPILFALGFFLWKVWKRAKDAYDSYEQNYTDLAVLESAFERFQRENQFLRCDINALQVEELLGQMRRLREGHNELQGEIVQDSSELVHYGLVQLGGFTFFQTLDPGHRRHMYELERGSMVAHRTMGADRYLAVVRQQNQGTARGGDDTDMLQDNSSEEALREIRAQVHEQLESDEEEGDDVGLAPSENNFNIATETLRSETDVWLTEQLKFTREQLDKKARQCEQLDAENRRLQARLSEVEQPDLQRQLEEQRAMHAEELQGLQAGHSLELERLREELGRERELHREAATDQEALGEKMRQQEKEAQKKLEEFKQEILNLSCSL